MWYTLLKFGIEIDKLNPEAIRAVQAIVDKYHKKIEEGGIEICGRLLLPSNTYIKSCYEWCEHDIVNFLVKTS